MKLKNAWLERGWRLLLRSYWQHVASQHQMVRHTRLPLVQIQQPSTISDYYGDNTAIVTNLVDGLLEMITMGTLIPALAKDWSVSKDGLTYTYKLREDAKWLRLMVKSMPPVKAQDFVTGIKYAAGQQRARPWIWFKPIKGLDDYVTGAKYDFSNVGVKALDDYTVEYTLTRPEPFWNSKTTNSILFL